MLCCDFFKVMNVSKEAAIWVWKIMVCTLFRQKISPNNCGNKGNHCQLCYYSQSGAILIMSVNCCLIIVFKCHEPLVLEQFGDIFSPPNIYGSMLCAFDLMWLCCNSPYSIWNSIWRNNFKKHEMSKYISQWKRSSNWLQWETLLVYYEIGGLLF